jgi:3-oxoacyl-[acyl-carrier protein] reductase
VVRSRHPRGTVTGTAPATGQGSRAWDMAATASTTTGISGEPTASADVAATIAFLVSDDASFVSGQVLYVAGGPRA